MSQKTAQLLPSSAQGLTGRPASSTALAEVWAVVFRIGVFAGLFVLVGLIAGVLSALVLYQRMWPMFWPTVLSKEVLNALKLTMLTTVTTTTLAALIATPSAYALSRYRIPFGAVVDTIIDLPIVLPPLTAGVCLLIAFRTPIGIYIDERVSGGVVFSPKGIILAQFFPTVGFCARALKGAFDAVDPRLESVARTLGCSEWKAFIRVTLPLARSGLLAGVIMTWARAVGIFGPIIMFCGATPGKTEVLPIAVFLRMSSGRIEEALSVAIIMLTLAIVVLLAFRRLGGRGYLW